MIIHFPSPPLHRSNFRSISDAGKVRSHLVTRTAAVSVSKTVAGVIAATVVMTSMAVAAVEPPPPPQDSETMSNVPQTLSGECGEVNDCRKPRIQRPKSRKAELCTVKCVNTCIRGGDGAPGEGPLNIRRPLVVFKEGFRSRNYCLVECSDICNLIGDGDYEP